VVGEHKLLRIIHTDTADSSDFGEEMRQPLEVAEDLTFKETGVPE